MPIQLEKAVVNAARNEITEYHIYTQLAKKTKSEHNRKILDEIAQQELKHNKYWQEILGYKVEPRIFLAKYYPLLASIFGLSFALKLMEKGEDMAQKNYAKLLSAYPKAQEIIKDEEAHEKKLLEMINEPHLQYVSSFVLGLNDALVELTGALAGLTLALGETRLIAMVGLITGIAASLAMAGSEYLSTQEENTGKELAAGAITGIAYFITVLFLIAPFLLIDSKIQALAATLVIAVLIILVFTFYTAIAKGTPFKKKFSQMIIISLGAAIINFGIAFAIKNFFGIEA